MEKWNEKAVAERLEESIRTLRRMPPVKAQSYFTVWPAIQREAAEILAMEKKPLRLRALPAAIDRMEETLTWMLCIEVEERHLVWKRAARVRWKTLCWELGCDRTTAWRKWNVALAKIAAHLNSRKD